MSRFILVRHGQTAWNKEQRFRGRKDVPLSEQGLKEAELVADALAADNVAMIYVSPLSRAVQTLTPLAARRGLPVTPLDGVIDMNFGDWEGLAIEEARQKYPDLFKLWTDAPEKITFPNGESLSEVQARAMRSVSRLAVEHPDSVIAVCTHRVVCKLIMLGLLGVKPDKFWAVRQDTACLNRFDYVPPRAIIHSLNDTAHLQALGGTLRQDF
jgi:broad specificity phosphatase PhoE